jgi:hypothetical protein
LFIALLTASCGHDSGNSGTDGGINSPTVLSTNPGDGATKVAVNATISATFSKAMSSASFPEAAFTLAPPTSGTITASSTTATFTPRAALAFATTYTATITTAVRDTEGNPLKASYTWTFTTVEAPPTVSSTDPASEATGVAINAAIKATFSKSIAPASLTSATFTVAPGVSGTLSLAGATASFTPGSPLAYATRYTATLTTGVKDLAGNALAANYSWSFTTAAQPSAPVAVAGPTQDVNRSSNVTLDGSGSSASSGLPLTYTWTQVYGTNVTGAPARTLTGVRPKFAAPSAVGTLQFDLVVNDTIANSAPSRVQINVMKDATKAIFVATTGRAGAAGTSADPLQTIQAAIAAAKMDHLDLYVGAGNYREALTLADGVSIFGGFDPSQGWVRATSATANVTTIDAPTASAVSGSSLGLPVELDMLAIRSAAATANGGSSIAVKISSSAVQVVLRGCTITASDGAMGSSGSFGSTGESGGSGGNGLGGNSGGGPGAGGNSTCAVGGGGGGGGVTGSLNGLSGSSGAALTGGGSAGSGGNGASGSGKCGDPFSHGNNAPDDATGGQPGQSGQNGAISSLLGSFSTGNYGGPAAGNGTAGKPGGGGGGGGSGSGDATLCGAQCCQQTSGGGGGGGAAGCGGSGGTGGRGGGGSFAVVSLSSNVIIDSCQLSTGKGGAGGAGGSGGGGGQPGSGGSGGPKGGGVTGAGAPGKSGGAGATAGNGAGGSGGPSICVAFVDAVPSRPSTTCTLGSGGAPGSGGSNSIGTAPNGQTGLSAEISGL